MVGININLYPSHALSERRSCLLPFLKTSRRFCTLILIGRVYIKLDRCKNDHIEGAASEPSPVIHTRGPFIAPQIDKAPTIDPPSLDQGRRLSPPNPEPV